MEILDSLKNNVNKLNIDLNYLKIQMFKFVCYEGRK